MYITQCDDKDDFDVCRMRSVGYLIKETDGEFVLAGDLVDGEYRRVIIIPKENVQNVYHNGKLLKNNK